MALTHVAEILGGERVLGKRIRNRMDMIELSKSGVSKGAATNLAEYLTLSAKQLSTVLMVSERTLQRYRSTKHFNPFVSERVLQIAEVTAKGTEVFGDKTKFIQWVHSPIRAFDDRTPFEMLNSAFGAEMVLQELGRIEHGVFS